MSPKKVDFKTGETVVYPKHGFGEIIKVESMEIANIKTMFYVVKMEQSKLIIRVPVEKQENLKEQTRSTGGMVKMVSLLTSIDQVGSCDSARESEGDYLFRNFSEVARKKKKYGDLDSLDNNTNSDIPF